MQRGRTDGSLVVIGLKPDIIDTGTTFEQDHTQNFNM